MLPDPSPRTLAQYAITLHADPRLLHALVATAKCSNSPAIRYGAIALDEHGNIAGAGYSKMADGPNEARWGDGRNPPRLHAEMNALCVAEKNGYDVKKLRLFILPLSPAKNELEPNGYMILRDMNHLPKFSCSECGPRLEQLGIEINVFNGQRGWVTIQPAQAKRDGEELARLEAANPGKKCRGNSIPGTVIRELPLDADGYRYIPTALHNMDEIKLAITPEQEQLYAHAIATHALPITLNGPVELSQLRPNKGSVMERG